jgi:hypothetical protein
MNRERLPNRRPSLSFAFEHGGHKFTATVGVYSDGRPAELFLSSGKAGTAVEAVARDLAVVASIALQHGAAIDTLLHAITRLEDGSAAGPMGKLLDLIATK